MNTLLITMQKGLNIVGSKYLHYYLLKNGYNSFLLHLPNLNLDDNNSLEEIKKFISEISPMFIGISLMSIEYHSARGLTKYLKSNFKSIPVIWGGIHPTISPETSLDYADYLCIGEGERTILDFANALSNNKDVKTINNLCYTENGQIKKNILYPLIENLDEIPLYDHIPFNGFFQKRNGRIIPIDRKIFKKHARYRGTTYSIMTSRGCPFSCTYCCNNYISRLYHTRKIRRRSIKNVILELEKAVNENPEIEYINFHDDCFLACSDEYLQEFCKVYKELIRKPFIVRAIPIYITRNKIEYLNDAGLAWISLGLQSGSDRICREIYKRGSSREDFLNAAEIIKDFNIAAFYDVILDNPFESDEERLETIQTFIKTPKPFYPQIFSLRFYLGTELYDRAKKECSREVENSFKKDYYIYRKNTINNMVRLSAFLNEKTMNKIVYLYKQDSEGLRFRVILFIANLLSLFMLEPIVYFRVIKLSQGGSYTRTLKVIPNYFREGFMHYLNQIKGLK